MVAVEAKLYIKIAFFLGKVNTKPICRIINYRSVETTVFVSGVFEIKAFILGY